jgi:hypothetical protein
MDNDEFREFHYRMNFYHHDQTNNHAQGGHVAHMVNIRNP